MIARLYARVDFATTFTPDPPQIEQAINRFCALSRRIWKPENETELMMRNPFETEERRAFTTALPVSWKPKFGRMSMTGTKPAATRTRLPKRFALLAFSGDIPEEFGGLGFDDQHMRKAAAVEMAAPRRRGDGKCRFALNNARGRSRIGE